LYKREGILLELFVHSSVPNHGFSHICLEIKDRENIVSRCEESEYKVVRIKRNGRTDMLFIKDKAENIFELKEGN